MRKRNMTLCILITVNACGRRRITCVVIPHRHIAPLAWRHWYIRIKRPVRCIQCERFWFGMKRSNNYMAKIIRNNSYANAALLMLTHIPSPVLSVSVVLHVCVAVIVYLKLFFPFSNFGFILGLHIVRIFQMLVLVMVVVPRSNALRAWAKRKLMEMSGSNNNKKFSGYYLILTL